MHQVPTPSQDNKLGSKTIPKYIHKPFSKLLVKSFTPIRLMLGLFKNNKMSYQANCNYPNVNQVFFFESLNKYKNKYVKLISWNLNSRSNKATLKDQVDYLLSQDLDVIALQEVTKSSMRYL